MRVRAVLLLVLVVLFTGGGSPAHALVKPPLIDGEKVLGGVVKTGKGVSRFGRIVPGPVGAILTAGSLAWWAYSEYDQKVHAPQPGGDTEAWLGAPAPAYPTSLNDGTITATVTSVGTRSITMEIGCAGWVYYSGSAPYRIYKCGSAGVSPGGSMAVGTSGTTVHDLDCKNTTTNVHTTRTLAGSWGHAAYYSEPSPSGADPTTTTITGLCNTGEQIDGFRIGPWTSTNPQSSTWYQGAPIGWGTLSAAPTTYPPGTLTFATAVVDVTCRNAVTDAVEHLYATSAWGTAGTIDLPSCKQRLGDEWYGTGVKVIPMDPEIDDVPVDPEVWPDWDVPDFVPEEWTEEEATPEEEADPCFGSKKGCGLTVEIDGEPVFPGTTTRTKIETLHETDPARITCKWGTRTVDWKYCIPILPSFDSPTGETTIDPTKPETGNGTDTGIETGTQTATTPEGKTCMAGWSILHPIDTLVLGLKCAFIPKTWPAWESIASPLPAGWVPTFPTIGAGTCGPVMMPGGLNLGPLYPSTEAAQLFDSCDFAPVRAVTYYGTLALVLVGLGLRAFNAATGALGMRVEGGDE